jgi:hypothetical protein
VTDVTRVAELHIATEGCKRLRGDGLAEAATSRPTHTAHEHSAPTAGRAPVEQQ